MLKKVPILLDSFKSLFQNAILWAEKEKGLYLSKTVFRSKHAYENNALDNSEEEKKKNPETTTLWWTIPTFFCHYLYCPVSVHVFWLLLMLRQVFLGNVQVNDALPLQHC